MKYLIIFVALISSSTPSDFDLWETFKKEHNKIYPDVTEETVRFNIFQSNLRKIEDHNTGYKNGVSTHFLGINYFADWPDAEISQLFVKSESSEASEVKGKLYETLNIPVPDSFDWRTKGVVTNVTNQLCSDGWAHATCGILEGQYSLNYGDSIPLSPQNLVDCTRSYGNFGCGRGYYSTTYKYILENGIESETDYPYYGLGQNCTFNSSRSILQVDQLVYLPANDEDSLKEAVATIGPIGIFLDATYITLYSGGIYNDTYCSNTPVQQNHAVLVVGYGNEENQDFWLIKNSWGTAWGDKGYIKLARNANNLCGVAVQPTYITLV